MCKNVMFLYPNQIQTQSMSQSARPVGKLNFGMIRSPHDSYGKVQGTLHRRKHLEGWEAARSSVLLFMWVSKTHMFPWGQSTAPLWAKMVDSDDSHYLASDISLGHLESPRSLGPLTPSQPKEIVFLLMLLLKYSWETPLSILPLLQGFSKCDPDNNNISSTKRAC